MSDSKMLAIPSHPNASTNDGTHRLTFRWKPKTNYNTLAGNSAEWLSTLLDTLNVIFADRDGAFYRWESEDLSHSCPVSKLTIHELREFISPKIASLDSLSTFVFGLRFSFSDHTPLRWRNSTRTKQALSAQGLSLNLSNSTCSSGALVNAGFILFKAPNTTHRDKYLQHLRNQLPETAPFFDLYLLKKTPTGDNYHHLVVKCGENHVSTLTSALSAILTGKSTAFFLPRLAFAKISNDKLKSTSICTNSISVPFAPSDCLHQSAKST